LIIVLTSLSTNKAAIRVEKVADAYFRRIAASTWIGAVSEEGLRDVRLAISRRASRHTVVSCFRVRGHDNYECAWQIGTQTKTKPTGEACVSRRRKQKVKQDDPE
jgi:CRISPR-associated endonuclease/helicase Cas3